MTQEEKQLLLKDLCARIPYRTLVQLNPGAYNKPETCILTGIDGEQVYLNVDSDPFGIDHIKPYLRPISSITESEIDKLFDILYIDKDGEDEDWIKINDVVGIRFFFPTGKYVENVAEAYDCLNSIHLDYRGLIKKGLAIEAPEGMYKTK